MKTDEKGKNFPNNLNINMNTSDVIISTVNLTKYQYADKVHTVDNTAKRIRGVVDLKKKSSPPKI